MKKILMFTAILMLALTSNATFHRILTTADLNREKEGWDYTRSVDASGNVWVHCFPDYENCGLCPMVDPGGSS